VLLSCPLPAETEACARVAELADALDSGFRFERFPTLSLTFFDRAELFGNTSDNALFKRPQGAIERKVKLAQKLAQLRKANLHGGRRERRSLSRR